MLLLHNKRRRWGGTGHGRRYQRCVLLAFAKTNANEARRWLARARLNTRVRVRSHARYRLEMIATLRSSDFLQRVQKVGGRSLPTCRRQLARSSHAHTPRPHLHCSLCDPAEGAGNRRCISIVVGSCKCAACAAAACTPRTVYAAIKTTMSGACCETGNVKRRGVRRRRRPI